MAKMKADKMWGLWNYGTLYTVEYRRRKCRDYANTLMSGGKEQADKMFRSGAFRITKVSVREI